MCEVKVGDNFFNILFIDSMLHYNYEYYMLCLT